ncbi:tetratricopeptide repeat protein [Chondromyces apiculatus]|uniref:Zinc finger/thioredoxin putative n=1 Tax=Chondromyces apiculatus DSM 436 TaxID=1192034 RepID=A0A017TB04_9BACT|nr:tetratricopeptide repeat protein [Chondromyces apiculatus]EYF06424.1 zinc finger/thioredoxin putative [Chondromyces apiculatus DSM 436]
MLETCYPGDMRAIFMAALVALGLGATACSSGHAMRPAPSAPNADATPLAAAPSWVPPYTAAQQALLTPPDTPLQARAPRVFPDLTRFGYAGDHRMEDPEESLHFTRMVVTVIDESPRLYVIMEAAPELSNTVIQYGPTGPQESDEWQLLQRDDHGVGRLSPVPDGTKIRAAHTRGEDLLRAGNATAARAAFEEATTQAPRHPAAHIGLARALVATGALGPAEQSYQRALAIDPTLASAHTGLAELAERKGDVAAARRHIAEALAYHPRSRNAWTVAGRLTPGGAGQGRIDPFRIFLDVDSAGAIHVGSAPSGPAQVYAGCRAVLRYEPEVRAEIFKQPESTPYYLTIVEEVVCLEAAIGAYLIEQAKAAEEADDPTTPRPPASSAEPDPQIEALARIAHEEGLTGYAMFEILGAHRPERARGAPQPLHESIVRYVERHILSQDEPSTDGLYQTRAPNRAPNHVSEPRRPRTHLHAAL